MDALGFDGAGDVIQLQSHFDFRWDARVKGAPCIIGAMRCEDGLQSVMLPGGVEGQGVLWTYESCLQDYADECQRRYEAWETNNLVGFIDREVDVRVGLYVKCHPLPKEDVGCKVGSLTLGVDYGTFCWDDAPEAVVWCYGERE